MGTNSLLKGNNIFEKYIKKHFIKYIVVLVIYLLGFLMGIAVFNKNIEIEENIVENIEMVLCKDVSDAVRMYNKIEEWVKIDKNKQIKSIKEK